MKACTQCQSSFEVSDIDRKFYDKVSPVISGKKFLIPEPALCPMCREQLRLAWKNERKLYKRDCDLCKKSVISIYSKDKPYPVYCRECWWGDNWDPMDYGQEYNPGRLFFDQMKDLLLKVPKMAAHQNNNAENCEYTTSTTRNRNCYLISSAGHNEDCYYGIFMPRNKSCVDNTHIMDSELCYECVDADEGYGLAWCQNTKGCHSSRFLYDCHTCSDCFFCFGLRGQKYCFRNEKLSKEEYQKRMAEIDFASHAVAEGLKKEFAEFIKGHARLYYEGQNNEEVTASNHIFNSKGCTHCFDSNNLEDCAFCSWYNDSKDCYDVYAFGYGNELCYNSLEVGTAATRVMGCVSCWDAVTNLYYCFTCHTSQDLFGCAGLKRHKFCILNKQYSEAGYYKKIAEIIENMRKSGEWGEFFPANFSPFGYNETMAMDFYPLVRAETLAREWPWRDVPDEPPKVEKTIPASRLPDRTAEIPDDVLNWAIKCEATDKPFVILAQELKFYREHGLPFPHFHPDERHRRRLQLRNSRRIHIRQCGKCGTSMQTTYAPDRPEKVYCETCYLKEVY